ncbi:MAG TPA: glycosyl hydrolase [Prolixibacteraceae bacterium]
MQKKIYFLFFLLTMAAAGFAQKQEAESATLAGGATKVASSEASGGYYVAQNDGNLTFNVTLAEGASYNIYLQVASPYGIKSNNLVVDGNIISFNTALNASYIHLKVVSFLQLAAGAHTIQITKSWGWINIDYIEFEKADPASRFNINKALITPNPTDEVTKLYQFLYDNYCKKIISGVMDMADAEWLKTNTGKYPALVGLDFMQTGRGYTWYNDDTPFLQAQAWYAKNGIPAMCWHWRDPSHKTEAFYTKDTPFDISKISDPNSAEYIAMIKDIDYTAGLLKKFQDNHIPILWRPLHEAAGGWFWWGAKGAAPCKKLWQVMYDRMVNYHGLHNMIWVWTREPNDDAWYPGDAYVDIVGRDIYKTGDHGSQITEFNDMASRYGGKKMITVSECGSMPDADNLVKDGAGWSYFMPWYGDFVRSSTYNSLDLWKKQFASEYVLTLDEMPNLKTYSAPAFSMVGPYCTGASIPALPTTSTNGITGTWSPAINNTATTDYTFTPTAGQNATLAQMTITIVPLVKPTFAAVGPFCAGGTIAALPTTSTNGIHGFWSPAINNTNTTEYTFTPDEGQCSTTTRLTMVVATNLIPEFAAVETYCAGATIPALPTTSLNGIQGTWSPAVDNTLTTEYTFTPALECAAVVKVTIHIDQPVAPTFTSVGPYCVGSTITALPTISSNGISGTWSPALSNTVTKEYTFTPTAGQCAATARMTIIIDPLVTPTFAEVGPYCVRSAIPELPTTSINGINGKWSPALNNTAMTTYTFTPDAGQCARTAKLTITIEPKLKPTFTVPLTYMQGATIATLPGTSIEGIGGTWSPELNNQATTDYTFTPTAGQCAVSTVLTIAINPTDVLEPLSQSHAAIRVFPSIFESQFNIQSDESIQSISVYNQLGIEIKTMHPNSTHFVVSLSGFPSGVYLVKADQQATIKVIKR